MKVIIGSNNPTKIQATEKGFQSLFPDISFIFEHTNIQSNVSDQPMTDDETRIGALNRVQNLQKLYPDYDYYVGIEGGIEKDTCTGMNAFAWVVIAKENKIGQSRSASFSLPVQIVDLINQGYELGEADDMVFKQSNSKQKTGAVGLLTHNVIDRTDLYRPAVILSLIPFKNKKLYD